MRSYSEFFRDHPLPYELEHELALRALARAQTAFVIQDPFLDGLLEETHQFLRFVMSEPLFQSIHQPLRQTRIREQLKRILVWGHPIPFRLNNWMKIVGKTIRRIKLSNSHTQGCDKAMIYRINGNRPGLVLGIYREKRDQGFCRFSGHGWHLSVSVVSTGNILTER